MEFEIRAHDVCNCMCVYNECMQVRESSTQCDMVYSETKALCPMGNFIIIFMVTTIRCDAIMKILKDKGWSVETLLCKMKGF